MRFGSRWSKVCFIFLYSETNKKRNIFSISKKNPCLLFRVCTCVGDAVAKVPGGPYRSDLLITTDTIFGGCESKYLSRVNEHHQTD
jgi:hypothetical protein